MVKSAKRVMEIFEFFAEHKSHLSVNAVSTQLGYPQSSTSVLLHNLTKLGYLTYDRKERTFFPTLRIASVGSWLLNETDSRKSPLQLMENIANACGHTVVLGVQNGNEVFYVQVIQATNALRFYMRPGSFRPICSTAIGRLLLSLKSEAEVRSIVRRVNAERSKSSPPVKVTEILESITRARKDGYVATEGTAVPGAAVVAMLLPPQPDQPPMGIGIGMPIEDAKANLKQYVNLLSNAIARNRG